MRVRVSKMWERCTYLICRPLPFQIFHPVFTRTFSPRRKKTMVLPPGIPMVFPYPYQILFFRHFNIVLINIRHIVQCQDFLRNIVLSQVDFVVIL